MNFRKNWGKIMSEFVALRPKTYSNLMDDGNVNKKLNDLKNYLLNTKIILKSQQQFKSELCNVYNEQINKISLSNNDDKRLKILIELCYILMVQVLDKYAKQNCQII